VETSSPRPGRPNLHRHSPGTVQSACTAISAPRLNTYLAKTGGNPAGALAAYEYNLRLSGAIYEALAIVEVALRNALDRQLRTWNATQATRAGDRPFQPDWTLDPAPLLKRLVGADLRKAVQRVPHHGRTPSHDDVLAQLTFGTWRYLLPDGDPGKRYLWQACLSNAFPHLTGSTSQLLARVSGLHRYRNRVAHLEPIFGRTQVRQYERAMLFIVRAIDPELETWLASQARITAVLATQPLRWK